MRIVRKHRIGVLAAHAECPDYRLCHKRNISATSTCSPCECLASIILADIDTSVSRVVFYDQRLIIATHAVGRSHRLCHFQRASISRILRMILEHPKRRRNDPGSQCRGDFLLIADATGFGAVFRGESCCVKHSRVIAVILCDQCERLVLGDADTRIALCIQAVGSISSVRPSACLSNAFRSTSGSSFPRADALRRIPRQAFGLK